MGSVNFLNDDGELIPPIYKLDKTHKYFAKSDIVKRDMFGMGLSFPLSQGDIKWVNIKNTWRYIFAFDQMLRPEDKLVGGWEVSFNDIMFAYIKNRFYEYKRQARNARDYNQHEFWVDNQQFLQEYDWSMHFRECDERSYIYLKNYIEARQEYKFRKKGLKIDGPIKVNKDTKDIYD